MAGSDKRSNMGDGAQEPKPGASSLVKAAGGLFLTVAIVACSLWYSGRPSSPGGVSTAGPAPADQVGAVGAQEPLGDVEAPSNIPKEPAPAPAVDPGASLPETPSAAVSEGRALIEQLRASFPDSPDALEISARVCLWLGDSETAQAMWEKCLKQSPRYAYAYHGLGGIAAKQGDYEQAVRYFRLALEIEPKLSAVRRELALALIDQGQAAEAVRVLDEYVAANPQLANGYVLLGQAYQQSNDWQRARESYAAALERDPNHSRAAYGLSTVCGRLGQQEESQKYLARFRQLLASEGAARRGERSGYDDLTSLREGLAGFYTDAGRVCFAQGAVKKAEELCRRAAALSPRQTECRQALAWICRRQGRLAEAIELLEDLAKQNADAATCFLEIGRLQSQRGRWSDAETAFRKALELAPDADEIKSELQLLEKQR